MRISEGNDDLDGKGQKWEDVNFWRCWGRRDDYLTELHKIMREDDEEWLSGDDMMLL